MCASLFPQCGWYWGPMNWEDAELKLKGKPDGSFLVRDSSDPRYILSLSFRSQGVTHHTRMEHYRGKQKPTESRIHPNTDFLNWDEVLSSHGIRLTFLPFRFQGPSAYGAIQSLRIVAILWWSSSSVPSCILRMENSFTSCGHVFLVTFLCSLYFIISFSVLLPYQEKIRKIQLFAFYVTQNEFFFITTTAVLFSPPKINVWFLSLRAPTNASAAAVSSLSLL